MSGSRGATGTDSAERLARLHLRTGLVRLARVELEQLAGEGGLERDAILDLAEARWRTGDLRGAAEAAGAWHDTVGTRDAGAARDARARRARALAHALIADGLAVRGRDDDAAFHVTAALDTLSETPGGSLGVELDRLFAGMPPRSDAWPGFGPDDAGYPGLARDALEPAPAGQPARRTFPPPEGRAVFDSVAAAADRLRAGDDPGAAVLLMLALRATPGRAAEILAHADAALAGRPAAALFLARAEALGALGRHEAAAIAYAEAGTRASGSPPADAAGPGRPAVEPGDEPESAPDAASVLDPEGSPP